MIVERRYARFCSCGMALEMGTGMVFGTWTHCGRGQALAESRCSAGSGGAPVVIMVEESAEPLARDDVLGGRNGGRRRSIGLGERHVADALVWTPADVVEADIVVHEVA